MSESHPERVRKHLLRIARHVETADQELVDRAMHQWAEHRKLAEGEATPDGRPAVGGGRE